MSRPRLRISSGAPWEDKVAYRRAVRVGDHIWVAGTVAVDEGGKPFKPGDAGAQTERALEIIAEALAAAGAEMSDIVRTRVYVTDMSPETQAAVGAAHRAVFKDFPPASAMIGIAALAAPEFVVEIEAEAVIS